MQDLAGKNFVVTGANAGIGRVTALELARRGARVILACRSKSKTEPVIEDISRATGNDKLEYVHLDLSDLSSVRACAKEILDRNLPIHGLVNNGGLAGKRGVTKDGFELAFGTNHLGHYLFTRLLLPRIEEAGTPEAPARIVNVASKSHYRAKGIDWDRVRGETRSFTAIPEYEVSKLSNVLFTKELARRVGDAAIKTYAVHPGVVATEIWTRVPSPVRWVIKKFMITPEQGAEASLKCASAPELAKDTGKYYDVGGRETRPSRYADDAELAKTLWTRSAEWTGLPA